METKEIQKLIDFIANSGLDEVNVETSELKISVKRHAPAPVQMVAAPQPMMQMQQPAAVQQAAAPQPSATPAAVVATQNDDSKYLTIKSPMIGTFYRTQSPDKPPFVEIGDEVAVGKPVCIIEAMKLFNEIESDVAGRIVKVLVENASPVEYDQPLFLVEPS
jgi:acetyl-CoA carboxylase biotin carboxyl carrier protein